MFHVDLKLLRSFAAVACELSVTRAAERLHLTQPTVSGQIKELEQALGFSLFHRTTRHIALTPEGERLLPLVQSLHQCAQAVRTEAEGMQHAMKTRFRLGAAMFSMDFLDRVELIDAFVAARSDVRLTIDNRLQSDQVRDLLTGKLDASLLLGVPLDRPVAEFLADMNPGEIANEVQFPASLEHVVLRRRRIGLLVPEDSDLARYDVIPVSQLIGRRVAMISAEHGEAFVNPIANFLLQCGAVPSVSAEGNAMAVERHAQRHGICAIGIGWFATLPGMVRRPVDRMNFHMDLSLVLGTSPNPAARRFFDFAVRWQAARDALGTGGVAGDHFADPPIASTQMAFA